MFFLFLILSILFFFRSLLIFFVVVAVNCMKRLLSETSKNIIDSNSQMREHQQQCLTLVEHIKGKLEEHKRLKQMIHEEEEAPDASHHTKGTLVASTSFVVESDEPSNLLSHLKLMEDSSNNSTVPNDIEMHLSTHAGA